MGQLLAMLFGALTEGLGNAATLSKQRIIDQLRELARRIDSGELDLDEVIAQAKVTQGKIDSTLANLPE